MKLSLYYCWPFTSLYESTCFGANGIVFHDRSLIPLNSTSTNHLLQRKTGESFRQKEKMLGFHGDSRLGLSYHLFSIVFKLPRAKWTHIHLGWSIFFTNLTCSEKNALKALLPLHLQIPGFARSTLKSWNPGQPGQPNVACLCVGFHHSWCRRGSSTSTGKNHHGRNPKEMEGCKSPTFFHNLTWCLVGSMELVEPFLECLKKSNSNQCGGSFPSLMGAHGCRNDALKRSPPPKVKSHGPGFILIIYETRWFPIATWKVLKFSKQKWQEKSQKDKNISAAREVQDDSPLGCQLVGWLHDIEVIIWQIIPNEEPGDPNCTLKCFTPPHLHLEIHRFQKYSLGFKS